MEGAPPLLQHPCGGATVKEGGALLGGQVWREQGKKEERGLRNKHEHPPQGKNLEKKLATDFAGNFAVREG